MQKGDKARVINDCEVKAGSEVEVYECFEKTTETNVVYGISPNITVVTSNMYICYFNGIRVEIAESNLEVIKPERFKPAKGEKYFFISSMFGTSFTYWNNDVGDVARFEAGNCFSTVDKCDVMLAKIQAIVTSEIGEA